MRVADGVFQFQVPMPRDAHVPDGGLRYTLVYAVQTTEGWVLIDAGLDTDEGFGAFQRHLSAAGISPADIGLMVVTHGHPDHVGLASRIKGLTGARLAMHRLDAVGDAQQRWQTFVRDPETARRWMLRQGVPSEELREGFFGRPATPSHGHASPWRHAAPDVDMVLEGGEELVPGSGLRAVWTPGHTPGHVCIHDEKRRLLFSGDHVLPNITPHVSLNPGAEDDPLGRFLQSQRELKELDVEAVHPAHEHSFPDLPGRVDDILEHHRERMGEMLALVRDDPRSAWKIASLVKWNVAPWAQLGPWTRRMALMETIAHLQHMVAEGQLARRKVDSVEMYARA